MMIWPHLKIKDCSDPYPEIRAYVQATGVFPINTVITLKEETVQANPDLPKQLMAVFQEARQRYLADIAEGKEVDHMGLDMATLQDLSLFPDAYGIASNHENIRLMIQYCYEQGVIRRLFEPEDLFVEA